MRERFRATPLLDVVLEDDGTTRVHVAGKPCISRVGLVTTSPLATRRQTVSSIDDMEHAFITLDTDARCKRGLLPHLVEPREKFLAHCSIIQAWVEHDYDTRLMRVPVAFKLLRRLSEAGDEAAKIALPREIRARAPSATTRIALDMLETVGSLLDPADIDRFFTLFREKADAGSWNSFAYALDMAGWYQQAIIAANEGLAIDPNLKILLNTLGDVYLREPVRDLARASTAFDKVIALAKTDPRPDDGEWCNVPYAWAGSGRVLHMQHHYQLAVMRFEKANELVGSLGTDDSWLMYASSLARTGQNSKARDIYRKVVGMYPGNLDAWLALGKVSGELGDWKGAIEAFKQATTLAPEDATSWVRLGSACLRQGSRDALAAFEQATTLDPENHESWGGLGGARAQHGDPAGAIPVFTRAIALKQDVPGHWRGLGLALSSTGDVPQAMAALRKASWLDPQDLDALMFLDNLVKQHPALVEYLGAPDMDSRVRTWSPLSRVAGEAVVPVRTLYCHGTWMNTFRFSRDGTFLAISHGMEVLHTVVWDMTRNVMVLQIDEGGLGYAFSPDNRYLAIAGTNLYHRSASREQVVIFDMQERRSITSRDPAFRIFARCLEHARESNPITSIDFSPDGRYLAWGTGTRYDRGGHGCLWDLKYDRLVRAWCSRDPVSCVRFSNDGEWLAVLISECKVEVVDLVDLEVVHSIHPTTLERALHSDSHGWGMGWDEDPDESDGDQPYRPVSIGFSGDSRFLAIGCSSGLVAAWSAAEKKIVQHIALGGYGFEPGPSSITLSRNGDLVGCGFTEGPAVAYNMRTGSLLYSKSRGHDAFESLEFRPSTDLLAVHNDDGFMRLFDGGTGKLIRILAGHGYEEIKHHMFSPDGLWLGSLGDDNIVVLWDRAFHPAFMFWMDGDALHSIALQPDGSWEVLARSGASFAATSKTLRDHREQFHYDMEEQLVSFNFSFDGKILMLGTKGGMVFLWDIERGTISRKWKAHSAWVSSVMVTPDGSAFLTTGDDTVKLWSTESLSLLRELEVHEPHHAWFSPEGRLFVYDWDGSVAIGWDSSTWKEVGMPDEGEDVDPDFDYYEYLDSVSGILSPDARFLIPGGTKRDFSHDLVVKENRTNQELFRLSKDALPAPVDDPYAFSFFTPAFSPDSSILAVPWFSGHFPYVGFWDTGSWQLISLSTHDFVRSLAFSPTGKLIAGSSHESRACLSVMSIEHLGVAPRPGLLRPGNPS